MLGHTCIFRRNGTYYLRAKVPGKLRAIVGKLEFFESLRTKDYKEAVMGASERVNAQPHQFPASRIVCSVRRSSYATFMNHLQRTKGECM